MQILRRFCLLVVVFSVIRLYQGILQSFLGLAIMDCAACLKFLTHIGEFKGGFFVLGCFSPAFSILGLVSMFALGLKVLQFTWHGKVGLVQFLCDFRGKSTDNKNKVSAKDCFDENCDSKIESCKCSLLNFVEGSKSRNKENSSVSKLLVNPERDDLDDSYERGCCAEDEEFDVLELRRLVKIERLRGDMAYAELEKERLAAASAADEAMAMILRLQREKSLMAIETNQYLRLAERKQEFHEEVIESLRWNIMQHETELSSLEENLKVCAEKLKQYVKGEESGTIRRASHSTMEDGPNLH